MAVSPAFRTFVLEQLEPFARLQARPMFGGVGLYGDGRFFALLDDDRLYFKVDDATRPGLVALGSGPFLPFGDPAKPMRGYYEVPGDLLEDLDRLEPFARQALAVAARAADRGRAKGRKA
ncbi:MAG: TfoX/Sxy family protein [Holophagaceae bacterium]